MTDNDVPVTRFTALSKRFGAVTAVAGLDLTIRAGETVALLGPNGAGKSTTISMLLGLTRPDSGSVELFGATASDAVRAGRIGAMLQTGNLPSNATVAELIALARAVHPRPLPATDLLAAAGLGHLAGRRLDKLSGGETQRVRFGFALAGDPDLLVLDEPTAGMDAVSRQGFWEGVRRRAATGRTVLFATHYLAEADEFADRVVVMSRGRVVADGTSDEIKKTAGRRTVSFDLAGEPIEGLDRLPGVREVAVRGDRAVLASDDADATVPALMRARGQVRGLEVTGAGLTEAFLALTNAYEEV
jgi:ABC-2 type transport system ATP-binding protein